MRIIDNTLRCIYNLVPIFFSKYYTKSTLKKEEKMKSEEIAEFLEIGTGAVEFILSNKEDFYAYVGKNLRFDVVKPKNWLSDLFFWNEWVSIFDIPIKLDPSFYWICSAKKPISPRKWVVFSIKNIIYLNKLYTQCPLYEERHRRVRALGESATFYLNNLSILRFISEICFPDNPGISFKWHELSRRAIVSLGDLSEAEKLHYKIPYDLIPALLIKLKDFAKEDALSNFIKDGIQINNRPREERIKYQDDYVDFIIGSLLSLNTSIEVEKKLLCVHPLLRAKALRRWVEEKTALIKSPLEAKRLYLNCFRRGDEELVLNKWKELSREAILSLKDKFEAKKIYSDCHPDLRPAIIVFLSSV